MPVPLQQQQPQPQMNKQDLIKNVQQKQISMLIANQQQQQQQQQQQFQQQQQNFNAISIVDKIKEFTDIMDEIKSSAAKLFDGKDISAHLLDYSVIKKKKLIQEKYKKINEEMEVLYKFN
jgi:hypothetical protein